MDKETFKKMLAEVLSDTRVQAKDDDGGKVGTPHPLSLYLYRIRQNEQHAKHSAGEGHDHEFSGRTKEA